MDFALKRQFDDGFATFHDSGGVVENDALIAFLAAQPALKAVSSHHFHAQTFAAPGFRFFQCALVRQPLERLVSIYKFYRRRDDISDDLTAFARSADISSFMDRLVQRAPYLIENAQTNTFANHGFYGRPTSDEDLSRALARFADFSLCAPMERFAEAMVALEYFNAPAYGGLDLAFVPQNVSAPMPGQADLRDLLGAQTHDWLTAINRRDAALWRFASDELDRRIAMVPDFELRLAAFRRRCERLTHGPGVSGASLRVATPQV